MDFNDLYWHDSIIRQIRMDRSNPGVNDSILFEIEWAEDESVSNLIFEDVYEASFQLNFGIVAKESILHAQQFPDHELVKQFKLLWKGHMDDVALNTYFIETNSTGGKIWILARGFSIKNLA